MGVASSFFEPQPCNFGKLDIFLRCSNDISTNFWNSSWGQTCQKFQKPVCPGNPEIHVLVHLLIDSTKWELTFIGEIFINSPEGLIIEKQSQIQKHNFTLKSFEI